MLKFKNIIKDFSHLRFVVDSLTFCTPMGRERLLDSSIITDEASLIAEFDRLDQICKIETKEVKNILMQFRDIRGTISNLSKGRTLNEVELFELKYFSYYVTKLSSLKLVEIEQLSDIFAILDPNSSGVVNFYIYDTYDSELSELRKRERSEELFIAIARREETVREHLSTILHSHSERLERAIDRVAEIDLLIAKSDYATLHNLVRPQISSNYGDTRYKGIFNLYLMSMVRDYQKIDIELVPRPTLITGANMSGKTMLLKTVALAQYMIQFGFFAPAISCEISLVDNIFISIGDSQREEEGLSSYASEILQVSNIIDTIDDGGRYLVLLDELARTTSPREGAAIVDAVTNILDEKGVMSLITTHYSSLQSKARCMRVRGFIEEKVEGKLTKENISRFIDYSLAEASAEDKQSSEAIRIAQILGVNEKLISNCLNYLK